MRVFVCVRTRNEARNIERFCRAYAWADRILIADGGSTDDTVLRAEALFDNVTVLPFPDEVESEGVRRNPEGRHANFLFSWAEADGADWTIFDDCDCAPNHLLCTDAPLMLAAADDRGLEYVLAVRLYLRGDGHHYPHLAKPSAGHAEWEPSLWGWRTSTHLRASEADPWLLTIAPPLTDMNRLNILPPHCLLHRPWPTDEVLRDKMAFYNQSGRTLLHDPAGWAGPLEPLPEWARDE